MYVLFDVGGTHTRLALTDGRELLKVVRHDTDASVTGFARFLGAVEELAAGERIQAVVGGMPGQTVGPEGILHHCPNLPQWEGLPVRERLSHLFGVPAAVANDTALVGLGEATRGAGRGVGIMVYVTVSTGVNGVRIVDGRIDRSAWGFEIGAQLVTDDAGQAVTLEALVGGASLEQRRGDQPEHLRRDPKLWRDEERWLARGLYNTLLHWSPEQVVLGGSMMRDIREEGVAKSLAELPSVLGTWPPIVKAELGDDGGLYGAMAYLATVNLAD